MKTLVQDDHYGFIIKDIIKKNNNYIVKKL